MKKFLSIIFIIFSISFLYAEDKYYESPMSIYKENYFISGDNGVDGGQVKFQISAKYALLYPSNIGLYAGYTQISSWHLYEKSAPFYDSNYSPEVFVRFESKNNFIDNMEIPFVDYIQVSPICHLSNGKSEMDSRSINTYYGQGQFSIGEHYNFGINIKIFNYYNTSSKNKDIEVYKGRYEIDTFFKIKSTSVVFLDKEELHFKFGGYSKNDYDALTDKNKLTKTKGWFCVEAQFRIITSIIQPKLFIQYWNGYGEVLLDYNKKDESIRAGLVF